MKPMRKEIADLIREAMELHELARDFYHRLAHRVSGSRMALKKRDTLSAA